MEFVIRFFAGSIVGKRIVNSLMDLNSRFSYESDGLDASVTLNNYNKAILHRLLKLGDEVEIEIEYPRLADADKEHFHSVSEFLESETKHFNPNLRK